MAVVMAQQARVAMQEAEQEPLTQAVAVVEARATEQPQVERAVAELLF